MARYFLRVTAPEGEDVSCCAFRCKDYDNGAFTLIPVSKDDREVCVQKLLKDSGGWKGRKWCSIEWSFDFLNCEADDICYDVQNNFDDILKLVKISTKGTGLRPYFAVFHAQQLYENGNCRFPHFHIDLECTRQPKGWQEYHRWINTFADNVYANWVGDTKLEIYIGSH